MSLRRAARGFVIAGLCLALSGLSFAEEPAGETCDNQGATIPGTVANTQNLNLCSDQTPCGRTTTYNPPVPQAGVQPCSTLDCHCCMTQAQSSYTQSFSCQDDGQGNNPTTTTCKGGKKKFIGSPVAARVSVKCVSDCSLCGTPDDFFAQEGE